MTDQVRSPGQGRLTVLYDARCRVCTRIAGRLAGLDREGRLRLVPLQRAVTDRPEVQRLRAERDLRRALHVIDEDGQWATGGEAMVRALERVPSLQPLASLARLPIARRLVDPSYRLFAANRARFSWLAGSFRPAQRIGGGAARRARISGRARSRGRGHGGSARSG